MPAGRWRSTSPIAVCQSSFNVGGEVAFLRLPLVIVFIRLLHLHHTRLRLADASEAALAQHLARIAALTTSAPRLPPSRCPARGCAARDVQGSALGLCR